jgi:hypothetical protein
MWILNLSVILEEHSESDRFMRTLPLLYGRIQNPTVFYDSESTHFIRILNPIKF